MSKGDGRGFIEWCSHRLVEMQGDSVDGRDILFSLLVDKFHWLFRGLEFLSCFGGRALANRVVLLGRDLLGLVPFGLLETH